MSLGSAYQGKQMQSAHGTSSSQLWERPTCWHYAITMLYPTSQNPPRSQAMGHATQLPNSKKPTERRLKLCEAPERTASGGLKCEHILKPPGWEDGGMTDMKKSMKKKQEL
ncbi:unnamed protein product [Leuciscus chuanchicus]